MKKVLILSILLLSITLSSCIVKQPDNMPTIITKPIVTGQILPTSCIDEDEGTPVITYISTNSGTIDTKIKIEGCNFLGFEGDKHVWIENEEGIKGLLYGEEGSSSKIINITLKSPLCQFDTSYSGLKCDSFLELIPGKYKIYVKPWGKVSNMVDFTIYQFNKAGMTESEAKIIAEKSCIKGGEFISPGYYNENSKTWWFDINLNSIKEGCNPACVVSEITKNAEINRRCTGLIVPKESTIDILTNLFIEKYPKYADTLSIKIESETGEHARGSVTFVSGFAGGYFLAAKIDGKWQIILDGNGQISCGLLKYGFPEDMLNDCSEEYPIDLSYQDIINYLNYNISDILIKYSLIKPTNGQWFADGFGFTSINNVYVDYEDGHYLYRALLECDNKNNILLCNPLAIFEKQKSGWIVIQGEDTQKNNEIIYKWAKDYEWER